MNVIGDNIHIDASSGNSSAASREAQRTLATRVIGYVRKHTAKFVFEVAAGICILALAAWLGLNSGGSSTQIGPRRHISLYGDQTDVAFNVENSARTGVWALKSPVMTSFSGHQERPLNAARWLANGTVVRARCARPGTAYELILGGQFTRWRFFAELEDGTYIAMAGFRQTTEDGAQHLIHCGGT